MPRRRRGVIGSSQVAVIAVGSLALAIGGCQTQLGDVGCDVAREIALPDTVPLSLLPNVRADRVGNGLVLIGADAGTVRWLTIDDNGVVGAEQTLQLPADTTAVHYALGGVAAPGDRVIVGLLTSVAAGTATELHFIAAPIDGTPAPLPGPAVLTFARGVDPVVTMGTTKSAMVAGLGWLDADTGLPMYALVDGQGGIVDQAMNPVDTEAAAGYGCLGFTAGEGEATLSYLRYPTVALAPFTWVIADFGPGTGASTLKLTVGQPGGGADMLGCALTIPTTLAGGYAMVWQDYSGSWLSVYYGPPAHEVLSYPFASSTDFGGPALQPPLRGLATFGADYSVVVERTRSVELWRLDGGGRRRDGALVYPSAVGDLGRVSSVTRSGRLTSTYADFTGASSGRRLIIDAQCY
jgi:hypothetical protein